MPKEEITPINTDDIEDVIGDPTPPEQNWNEGEPLDKVYDEEGNEVITEPADPEDTPEDANTDKPEDLDEDKPEFESRTDDLIEEGENVDIVTDKLYDYPFEDNSFDIVITGSTMEHVVDIYRWVKELSRITSDLLY